MARTVILMDINLTFKLYYRPLCLYATHYLHDISSAEDVVQDCFVRLVEAERDGRTEIIDIRPYLYAAVRNRCLNVLRASHGEPVSLHPTDIEGEISNEEAAEASLHEAKLWTIIDSLPAKCREVFLMSKQKGMKYREISVVLGISEKTVENHISKALRLLRGKAEDFFYFILGIA